MTEPARRAAVQMRLNLPMITGDQPAAVIVADYVAPRPIGEDQIRLATLVVGIATPSVAGALDNQRNRALFERLPIGLYRSTPDGRLLDVNGAMVRLLGYPDRQTLLSTHAVKLYGNPEDRVRWQQLMEQQGVVLGFEVQWRRFDGTLIWVRESTDAAGRPADYEGSAEDITARKRFEEAIHYLASHDALTGVFHQQRFQEELSRLIAEARRSGETGAVLFVDVDNFKEVNGRLGHRAGNTVLQQVAQATGRRLRTGETLARVGGRRGRRHRVSRGSRPGPSRSQPHLECCVRAGGAAGRPTVPADRQLRAGPVSRSRPHSRRGAGRR